MIPTTRYLAYSLAALMALASFQPADAAEPTLKQVGRGKYGFTRILVTQRRPLNPTHVYTYHQESLEPGGGLWIADFSKGEAQMTQLVNSPEGEILDANLHYDGHTILFSWKRTMSDYFQLYTIDLSGEGLRQLTDHASNNFNACWLPDGSIAFLSDRKPAFAYCWQTTTPILWRCDPDGANPVRLSANYLNDFTPSVLSNGRIVYSRWEYVDRPAIPIQSLWTINPDGTKLEGLFGNRALSPSTFMDAREIPGTDGELLCVLTAHNGPCRGGIGIITPALGANAQKALRNLTPEVKIPRMRYGHGNAIKGPYLNPFPLDDRYYLVSKEGDIELRDYEGEVELRLLRKRKGLGYYCPQPIRRREREQLFASSLPEEAPGEWATVMMQNVYNGLGDAAPPGSIRQLAIVQEVEKPVGISPDLRAFGFQFPVVSSGATYAPKKIWGYASVEPDGSAHFKVPARQPIYFLPLDEQGMAVQRMRTFTHLMPGEVQACVGCHADRNAAAPDMEAKRTRPAAMLRAAETLTPPEWGVHGFSYSHIVQPVWDAHCTDCHGGDSPSAQLELTGDRTDFFNVSYENLVRKGTQAEQWWAGGVNWPFNYSKYTTWIPTYNGQERNINEIEPGRWGAKASLLARVIAEGHPDGDGKKRVNLSALEKRRVYAWLDLNCPYYGTSDSNYLEIRGCRQQLPENFVAMINDVGVRRCTPCHESAGADPNWVFSLPKSFFVRIDNAEKNAFLNAPLAKSAGGAGTCGDTVFADTTDPDYARLLDSFAALRARLERRPRLDMLTIEDQKVTGRREVADAGAH